MKFIILSLQKRRLLFLSACLILLTAILTGRLIYLTVIQRYFLQQQGDARAIRTLTIPAYRGVIRDRHGDPLAVSVPMRAVWVDPTHFQPTASELKQLATVLSMTPDAIRQQLTQASSKNFVYLKRGLSTSLDAGIQALKLPGLFLHTEYRRYYPQSAVTAHVVGATNIDDQGQEGLERAYNHWLQGKAGLKKVLKDRLRHVVADLGTIRPASAGQDLQLSLDYRIQHAAFQALSTGIQTYQARSGSVVVLDVKTGEILAMVNWPSYNPNQQHRKVDMSYRNRAVTDVFEPGSTIKPFSMATALSSRQLAATHLIDTSPGWIQVAGKRVQDKRNYGIIDLTTVLRVSSNVGIAKLVLNQPPEHFWTLLRRFGFGETTASGFPGERQGTLSHFSTWNPFILATLSFGYGLSVSTLQLAQAYATLANEGIKLPVTFLKIDTPPPGQRVLAADLSRTLLTMLESVLSKTGTAPLASVTGYRVAGKTGTTRIVGPYGYEKHRYNSLFVGIAPASQPRLVIAVMLHEPSQQHYYGGYTAGVVFSHVMTHALRFLNIPPDNNKPTSKLGLGA